MATSAKGKAVQQQLAEVERELAHALIKNEELEARLSDAEKNSDTSYWTLGSEFFNHVHRLQSAGYVILVSSCVTRVLNGAVVRAVAIKREAL